MTQPTYQRYTTLAARPATEGHNRLFVYGIFLDKGNRDRFGMYNDDYDTVQGFVTRGSSIVTAEPSEDPEMSLTGITVNVDAKHWERLDALEGGYDRIRVITNGGDRVWMYAQIGTSKTVDQW